MGTPPYMSPEQTEHPDEVSYASDVFSLGIITYELYLGRFSHGVIQLDLLPKGLRKIIEKAIQQEPSKRYPDILQFIADLTQFLKRLDETPEETEPTLIESIQSILLPKKAPKWA